MIGEDVDVICIGAGFAGLTAALRAAEQGCSALVLERQTAAKPYNNSRVTTGVFHVASNEVRLGEDGLVKAIMDETHNYAKPELTRAVARNAGRCVDWLIAQGVALAPEESMSYVANRRHLVLVPRREMKAGLDWPGKGGDVALEQLERRLVATGGRVQRGVEVAALAMKDGRCVGVEARHDGGALTYTARTVVIADGGFQANPEMVRGTVTPDPARVRLRATASSTGDGIRMAEAVGARITELGAFYGHVLAREAMQDERLWPYPNIDVVATAAVIVDGTGRRFVDEGRGAVFVTNAIAKLADPLSASVVMTPKIWAEVGVSGVAPPNPEMTNNGGHLVEASDIASLAAAIEVPSDALAATLAAYNTALKNGALDRLAPIRTQTKAKAWPVEGTPYCAIRVCAGLTNTMGGIDIDAEARVLDQAGRPIPGLLAAGSSTGGLEGGPNAGYVGGVVKAFVLGLLAGETAAQEKGRQA
jgi:fumarate reductase flavoprotein subunit